MPVREKACDTAFYALMGDTPFHFYNNPAGPTATINGVTMPREEFRERFSDPIERIYERVVDSIDWNRVMIEAWQRHMAVGHGAEGEADEYSFPFTPQICPECLCEALLADDTSPRWSEEPKAPRYHK